MKDLPVGGGRVGSNPGGGTEKSILPITWVGIINDGKARGSFLPWLGKSSFHGSSLEFRWVQSPEEYFVEDLLDQD